MTLAPGPGNLPADRVRPLNEGAVSPGGDYVLYWMVATRRPFDSFALERAVAWAHRLSRPLLVLEPLALGYPAASPRIHAFVLQGMAANARAFAARRIAYHPWVERSPGDGAGLLEELAARACVVVTDTWPVPFLGFWQAVAARRVAVAVEAVDDVGLLPLDAELRVPPTAAVYRRWLQRLLPSALTRPPAHDPAGQVSLPVLAGLPDAVAQRWPRASQVLLDADEDALAALPLDAEVKRTTREGGWESAEARWQHFCQHRLGAYGDRRNHPGASSGLSPWLHFGHLSSWRLWSDLARDEGWTVGQLGPPRGQRAGWWGISPSAEAFLDQVVTWRGLAFQCARHDPDYYRFQGLPAWARSTLEDHTDDPRAWRYPLEVLTQAGTHDPIWNAAQRQLVSEGAIDGYLRMIWGKRLLEWCAHPAEAWGVMHALNDRWALDGRGPVGTAGIAWVLGRFDRPWGPERPVFGKIRYMSSERTAKKLPLAGYLARWASVEDPPPQRGSDVVGGPAERAGHERGV